MILMKEHLLVTFEQPGLVESDPVHGGLGGGGGVEGWVD